MKLSRQTIGQIILYAAVLLASLTMLCFPVHLSGYRAVVTDSQHYVRATVRTVDSESLSDSPYHSGKQLGTQELTAVLADGTQISVTNYLTEQHHILARAGSHIILCVDAPEGVEPYYTVYNYDRTGAIAGLCLFFLALMCLVGGKKGFDSALSIAFTLLLLMRVTIPAIYGGASPVGMAFLTVLASTVTGLCLLHGFTQQCALGVGVTLAGEGIACGIFAVFSAWLHITGAQTDSAEGLLLIQQNTGLQVGTLLFAATMIASLGAVMDVAVSMLSALREVAQAAQSPTRASLFRAGMNLGRDMIGTMSNTLIFAFAGGALTTMLVFYSYGVQLNQLLSSDYLAIELSQGMCGTAAVILTVPAAALAGAAAYAHPPAGRRRAVCKG